MERQGDEVHVETDEARGAESTGVMRWVLGIGLLLAIVLLSAIWMTGATLRGSAVTDTPPRDSGATVTEPAQIGSEVDPSATIADPDQKEALAAAVEPAATEGN